MADADLADDSPSLCPTVPLHGEDAALDAPRIDHPTSMAADLSRLLAELNELSARAPFTLTGTSPGGATFSVSGLWSDCLEATFSGEFVNSDNFIANWSAVKVGSCMCSNQNETVGGVRH